MKKVTSIYIIGPVNDESDINHTEQKFKTIAQRFKSDGSGSPAITGTHFFCRMPAGKSEIERFKRILDSDLVITLSGYSLCPDSHRDRNVAEWCRKEITHLNDVDLSDYQLTTSKLQQIKEWLRNFEKLLNGALEPVMTNPMKREQ